MPQNVMAPLTQVENRAFQKPPSAVKAIRMEHKIAHGIGPMPL